MNHNPLWSTTEYSCTTLCWHFQTEKHRVGFHPADSVSQRLNYRGSVAEGETEEGPGLTPTPRLRPAGPAPGRTRIGRSQGLVRNVDSCKLFNKIMGMYNVYGFQAVLQLI